MRVVVDTNVVLSGLLWGGRPGRLLDLARARSIELYSSLPLIAELAESIGREQFAKRIRAAGLSAAELVVDYAQIARLVIPAKIRPTVLEDPDDDEVLACAIACQADLVVSGDSHLRALKNYQGIVILNAADALSKIEGHR
ncbi:MAG: putative toxin-antitoxin system toxin component, PIN family [Betaproteobacteria bacterium]|nr:MAG: putative toxin-antitoxin system toxin component, PIN family [Betaproteobacteria bacterium]